MIVPKELINNNNPFGHGDLHTLPCPGLQQADTRPLSTNFYIVQNMSFIKAIHVLTNPFWTVRYVMMMMWPLCVFLSNITRSGLYGGQNCVLSWIILGQVFFFFFFCIPFNLSQQEMTKFSVWGPRKKCAVPSCDAIPCSCDGSGFESKIH